MGELYVVNESDSNKAIEGHICPIQVSLGVSEDILRSEVVKTEFATTRLAILAVTKSALKGVEEAYGCKGPTKNSDCSDVCPLTSMVNATVNFTMNVSDKIPFTDKHLASLNKARDSESSHMPGQYL